MEYQNQGVLNAKAIKIKSNRKFTQWLHTEVPYRKREAVRRHRATYFNLIYKAALRMAGE